MTNVVKNVVALPGGIKKLPSKPGVYFFKNADDLILYIGKAKNLKKRLLNYLQHQADDFKAVILLKECTNLEFIVTASELEAMLLEAQLIQSYQPKFNVLLKTGQPFVYLVITVAHLPELKIVRNKKQKGTYFGPFLEKNAARKVYNFLTKTFRLKLCKKKIENGCLDYHLGICAGACRTDFDEQMYKDRLELAKKSLQQGHAEFLNELRKQMNECSRHRAFERAQEIHGYLLAFEKVFSALNLRTSTLDSVVGHDVWILAQSKKALFLFVEMHNVLKKKQVFYFPLWEQLFSMQVIEEYLVGYYRGYIPAGRILINFDLSQESIELLQKFLQQWHNLKHIVSFLKPTSGHDAALVRYAEAQASVELEKQQTLAVALKRLLVLPRAPKIIDCFDISHKQGRFMVGACVRFTDGQPDKKFFRHFYIKTVEVQDDYAALQEIVKRRYKNDADLPDLIFIDGGKGQLNAVARVMPHIECASIAKKEETVFSSRLSMGKKLNIATYAGQVLIALRDYTHHFAVSFHRKIENVHD